jgi:hypothetical protein
MDQEMTLRDDQAIGEAVKCCVAFDGNHWRERHARIFIMRLEASDVDHQRIACVLASLARGDPETGGAELKALNNSLFKETWCRRHPTAALDIACSPSVHCEDAIAVYFRRKMNALER